MLLFAIIEGSVQSGASFDCGLFLILRHVCRNLVQGLVEQMQHHSFYTLGSALRTSRVHERLVNSRAEQTAVDHDLPCNAKRIEIREYGSE
jgi:hypothetical protein